MILHEVKVDGDIVLAQICPWVVEEILRVIYCMHFIVSLAVARTPIVAQIDSEACLNEKGRQRFMLCVEPRLTIHWAAVMEQDCTFDRYLSYFFISADDEEEC